MFKNGVKENQCEAIALTEKPQSGGECEPSRGYQKEADLAYKLKLQSELEAKHRCLAAIAT